MSAPTIRVARLCCTEDDGFSAFHPRCCVLPDRESATLLMTVQGIAGSDYFEPVQYCTSTDPLGSWSERLPIDAFDWRDYGSGITEGVCDVVPDVHSTTGTILAAGHTVYYKDNALLDTLGTWNTDNPGFTNRIVRRAVYVTSAADQIAWSERKTIAVPGIDHCSIISCGCGQKVLEPDGCVLIAMMYGTWDRTDKRVFTGRFAFDGQTLSFIARGADLEHPIGRGLLEPQVTFIGPAVLSHLAHRG